MPRHRVRLLTKCRSTCGLEQLAKQRLRHKSLRQPRLRRHPTHLRWSQRIRPYRHCSPTYYDATSNQDDDCSLHGPHSNGYRGWLPAILHRPIWRYVRRHRDHIRHHLCPVLPVESKRYVSSRQRYSFIEIIANARQSRQRLHEPLARLRLLRQRSGRDGWQLGLANGDVDGRSVGADSIGTCLKLQRVLYRCQRRFMREDRDAVWRYICGVVSVESGYWG